MAAETFGQFSSDLDESSGFRGFMGLGVTLSPKDSNSHSIGDIRDRASLPSSVEGGFLGFGFSLGP